MTEGSGSGAESVPRTNGSGGGGPKTYGSGFGSATLLRTKIRNIIIISPLDIMSTVCTKKPTYISLQGAGNRYTKACQNQPIFDELLPVVMSLNMVSTTNIPCIIMEMGGLREMGG